MKKIKLTISVLMLLCGLFCGCSGGRDRVYVSSISPERNAAINAAKGVLTRVMGKAVVSRIQVGLLQQVNGRDIYEYQASAETLTIRGSSVVAICRGVYDFLRAHNMGTVGWAGARLDIPDKWPTTPITRVETPFRLRHCYNAVTFGYTMPYWTWSRWRQELDWLAMHGFNMILSPIASEAIFNRVWLKYGLTQKEIDQYTTGPAHLPFHRMGCVRQVGGTLSHSWHKDQIQLQHQLLKRMRQLGIEPVVQGFSGFVPPAIKRLHPDITLHKISWSDGFADHQRPFVMLPDDDLFAKITKDYLTEWQKEFGKSKYILVDSFIEMKLPKTGIPATEMLASYGRKTYQAITSAIPDAVWTMQGWMFNYKRDIWNKDTVKSLLDAVPDDRLLILDYANEYNPNWEDFSGFHGKTWVMGYVPNMGGRNVYCGKLDFYASQAAKTLADPGKGNLVGFTISGEGLENNEVLYELMSDTAWSSDPIEVNDWLKNYCANRYQSKDPAIFQAWRMLHKSVYSWFAPHPRFGWQRKKIGRNNVYRSEKFFQAVNAFLAVADKHSGNPNYQDDALEMASIALSLRADDYFDRVNSAMKQGDKNTARASGQRGISLLLEADKLLASHSLHRLDRWIDLARAHGNTSRQKDTYEANAKQIITVWGPPVNDYSCRMWSGLIRDFYAPRMQKLIRSKVEGARFDCKAWEAVWIKSPGYSKIKPFDKPAQTARELVNCAISDTLPVGKLGSALKI